jgi:hypothetical protein
VTFSNQQPNAAQSRGCGHESTMHQANSVVYKLARFFFRKTSVLQTIPSAMSEKLAGSGTSTSWNAVLS